MSGPYKVDRVLFCSHEQNVCITSETMHRYANIVIMFSYGKYIHLTIGVLASPGSFTTQAARFIITYIYCKHGGS